MKTRIHRTGAASVRIDFTDEWGDDCHVEYFCPQDGGYVRRDDSQGRGQYPQVCERLMNRGTTLTSPSGDALLDVIRREWRAMMRNASSRSAMMS